MSSDAPPEVSVFIQTYQHADYIRDALDGVLGQRAPFEFEVVIADDCSTDGTREILREYGGLWPDRIRLLLPERNMGPGELFRRAVGELRGQYVAWLDGDDFWSDEEKLLKQVRALREHPEWAACFHDATVVDADGGAPERLYAPDVGEALTLADLLRGNCVPALSVMARGDLVRDLPDWVWKSLWSDWLALIAIAEHGDIGYLADVMGVYRVRRDGVSAGLSRAEQLHEDLRFFEVVQRALGAEHQGRIESCVRERHCQLAVERLRLPFDGAVGVLGPPQEAPTYLNGRHVWPLAIESNLSALDEIDRDGRLAATLERLRLAAAEAALVVPHFTGGERAPDRLSEGTLHLLVVEPMVGWLDRYSRLGRQLRGSTRVLWHDDVCALHEVVAPVGAPAPMGALVEISDVSLRSEPEGMFGCHIDAPVPAVIDAHAVEVAGWAIGDETTVTAVELAIDGKAFRRVPLGVARPDLERAFPDRPGAGQAGFRASLSLVGTAPETTLDVAAVLSDQRRIPFGSIRLRRRWRESLDGAEAPLVSVVVPCHGQARYLEETIGSVLAQTYAHVEIVVVDDGSPDNAGRVASRFPGVRCVRQENLGLAAARNAGIRESDGELLVFLDADDRLLPCALELGVEELRLHPEAAFAFGRYRKVAADGAHLEGDDQPRSPDPPYSVFLRYNYAGVPATGMFRRSALEQVGNFDETAPGAEDYELGLRISRQFAVRPHGEYVAEYRAHGGGMSRETGLMLTMTQRVLRRQRKYVRRDPALREAYRAGRRFWCRYYGEPLVTQVRTAFANREWRNGLRGVATLVRHHPRGMAALLRRPRAG